jgi:hypothetical protein
MVKQAASVIAIAKVSAIRKNGIPLPARVLSIADVFADGPPTARLRGPSDGHRGFSLEIGNFNSIDVTDQTELL